jgi:hypothetical protein
MPRYPLKEVSAALLAAFTAAVGCATSVESVGGEGGEGGEGGSGPGAGGGAMSLCTTDCSTIAAPACFKGICNEATATCEIVPDDGAPCDDGLFCSVSETCSGGTCGGGSSNPCGDIPSDGCSGAVCDEDQDKCLAQTLPDGTSCVVEDLCTVNATCKAGVCSGAPKDCFFAPTPDECFISACNPATGKCEPMPGNDGATCTDKNDLCTVGKICAGGVCQGGAPKCSYLNAGCTNGVCNAATGTCTSQVVAPGDVCFAATDDCNTGVCQPNNICAGSATNNGMACNDGNACTDADVCSAGSCAGVPSVDYEVYFSDTFASNAAGWTLGNEWQIGPATASTGGFPFGSEDPSLDHTATADNGVAGVVLGGYANEVIHSMYYLESPAFDGSGMGEVHLQFWRYLNSDYVPYMNNVVEVYNGAQWIQIWQSGAQTISDADWTFISHKVTGHKNANMKIRFGFDVGSSGVFTVSSWNVDDVVVANKVCP